MIFGSGGHAGVIASLLHGSYDEVAFLDERETTSRLTQAHFWEHVDDYRTEVDVFIGIGSNDARRAVFDKLRDHDVTPANCIAGSAYVAHNANLGRGVVLCPGSVVMAHANIGDNVIVNTLSSIDHDCVVGQHSQITAGVTFGGSTRVGESCFFGVKSATLPGVSIGDRSIVMAGSLITRDVPPDVMVGGSPARLMRQLDPAADR
jgi:sugar O-acyltransferase (sialic acid O-acetyltransferase NeuD family)